ncbi:MAG: hypothetical protein C6Y20_10435 [Tagaea sp. CACIAM 22H2]|nr:hypothetical protein [Tagaea sp. CACIAM 22H2]
MSKFLLDSAAQITQYGAVKKGAIMPELNEPRLVSESPPAFEWRLGPFSTHDMWHQRLQELYEYWRSLSRDPLSGVPARKDFDPFHVRSAVRWLWLCDVNRDPFRLKYRVIGSGITDLVNSDATGKWMDELPIEDVRRSVNMERFQATVLNCEASYSRGLPVYGPIRLINEVEVLCLPVSTGFEVDQLICCSAYHPYSHSSFLKV